MDPNPSQAPAPQASPSPDAGVVALGPEALAELALAAAALGGDAFHGHLVRFLRRLVDAEQGIAFRYWIDKRPEYVVVQGDKARQRGAREAAYTDGPYVLDPVYQMFQRGEPDGACAMHDYVPDDFQESEFFRCFFRNTRLIDTIDVLWRVDERCSIALCLGREEGTPAYGRRELAAVRQVLPLVFALLRRHHDLAAPPEPDEENHLVHRKVQSTMANFGASLLTPREREVVFYMLSGYSSEQTAQRLNTAEGTVRIHRKNIHRKLETGSQAELFSLFIQCIPFADPDHPSDPLERVQAPAKATPKGTAPMP